MSTQRVVFRYFFSSTLPKSVPTACFFTNGSSAACSCGLSLRIANAMSPASASTRSSRGWILSKICAQNFAFQRSQTTRSTRPAFSISR